MRSLQKDWTVPDDLDNIAGVFLQAADSWPDQTALIHDGRHFTYAELRERLQIAAGALQAKGIGKGDAVLVAVPISIELYVAVLALFYLGASPVFLDAWVSRRRMRECLETVPCRGVIAPGKLLWLGLLYSALRRIPVKCTPGSLLEGKPLQRPASADPDDTALVTFTTGSTGRPKAADRSHKFLHAQLDALRPLLPEGQQTSFTTLPIVVLLFLAMGKTTVLPPRRYRMKKPRSIRYLRREIMARDIHTIVASPSVMRLLAKLEPLPSLRRIITGGGPVFPRLAQEIISRFPEAECTIVYGSTEAEPISHADMAMVAGADAQMLRRRGLPVGLPDRAAAVRIIPCRNGPVAPMSDAAWEALCLPAGETGEIAVSGGHILRQYIRNREAEALNKIKVGDTIWHRTGDAGRMDEDGGLYFLGRCEEIIYGRDSVIFPVVVEHALSQLPGISGAAVLQTESGITVVLETPVDRQDTAVRAVLEDYGITGGAIVRVAKLPRDPRHLTKLDHAALRSMLRI